MARDTTQDEFASEAPGPSAGGFAVTAPLKPARLRWDGPSGTPRSTDFNDIYFAGDGLSEARHVFLGGAGLADLFAAASARTRDVVIGETGFGTGLNFLAAWELWRRRPRAPRSRLLYFSCDLFPLTPEDLARAHEGVCAAHPDIRDLAAGLQAAYPQPDPGAHDIKIAEDVRLRLLFDDAAAFARETFRADAWFLDGFAPAKNPDMWRAEVLNAVAARSKPGARLATFTAAGAVRRGLEAADFTVEKRAGFGAKRHMLTATFNGGDGAQGGKQNRPAWFDTSAARRISTGARVAIVGAGVAGAAAADALARRGCASVIFDPLGPASGASGNPGGLIMPRLDLGGAAPARFFREAYLFALETIARLRSDAKRDIYNECGALLQATDDDDRARQEKLIAAGVLQEGHLQARSDGLFFPKGGVIDPSAYVAALLGDAEVRRTAVDAVEPGPTGVRVATSKGVEAFDAVVIANGRDALRFREARTLPLSGVAGQVDWLPDAAAPPHAIAAGPYAAPAPGGGLLIGATYEKMRPGEAPTPSQEATRDNIDAARGLGLDIPHDATTSPRAAVRCQTPDRLPIVGPAPDWGDFSGAYDDLRFGRPGPYPQAQYAPGVFFLIGLGSRGLVTAPYCAAILAAQMLGDSAIADEKVTAALHPGRFFIRDLKRARPTR